MRKDAKLAMDRVTRRVGAHQIATQRACERVHSLVCARVIAGECSAVGRACQRGVKHMNEKSLRREHLEVFSSFCPWVPRLGSAHGEGWWPFRNHQFYSRLARISTPRIQINLKCYISRPWPSSRTTHRRQHSRRTKAARRAKLHHAPSLPAAKGPRVAVRLARLVRVQRLALLAF